MKTLILFLVLNVAAFGQQELDDDLRITSEKFMRKGEWSHSEAYGWNSYDCNRRFFYKCHDKEEMDSLIIQILLQIILLSFVVVSSLYFNHCPSSSARNLLHLLLLF